MSVHADEVGRARERLRAAGLGAGREHYAPGRHLQLRGGDRRGAAGLAGTPSRSRERGCRESEIGKKSPKSLLDAFERYIEGHTTLFDTI